MNFVPEIWYDLDQIFLFIMENSLPDLLHTFWYNFHVDFVYDINKLDYDKSEVQVMSIPKMNLPGKFFGEMIRELETNGKLGHFKNCGLFQTKGLDGNMLFATRDFWIEAGVNQIPVFIQYLGNEEKVIDNF